ncbi:MAG: serine/threonine-protein kinase [Bacteroidota bacterium]
MQQGDSSIGQVIDGYRILEVLGKGGMGIVYKAEDIALSRTVAIKMIAPDLVSNETFLRRFQSEARALARVESPFIVGVHALRKVEENFFIVMEYVDGWTLADEIEQGVIEFSRAHVVLKQMLQAFARAHSVGVIHRDIKPRNIMITKTGRVKVTDFGLAKLRQDDGKSTVTQGMAGTARYMSPEQVLGTTIDQRSDLYSLGMTMYEMLAGVLPFGVEEGTFTILKRIVEEDLPSPLEYNPNIPAKLVYIIQRAIAKDPEKRFQSAQQMLEAVEEAYATPQTATIATDQPAQIPVTPRTLQKTSKRNPMLIAGLIAGLVLLYPLYRMFTGGETGEPSLATQEPGATPTGTPPDNGTTLAALNISSIPVGATVFVGSDLAGVTSRDGLSLDLPAGNINLALQMDGYQRLDTMITVDAGAQQVLAFPLLRISQPIANAGTPSGGNPNQGNAGQTNPRPEVQPAATGRVTLKAEPAGRIFVNGERYTDSVSGVELPVGTHSVKFEDPASGASRETTVTVRAGQTTERICYFVHQLNIQLKWVGPDEPASPFANLFINGKADGTAPVGDYPLTPGEYTFSLKRRNHTLSEPQTLQIAPTFDIEETKHKLFFDISKAQ